MLDMKLNVSEFFYSLQGEGARAGTPNIFIRLQGCKAKSACASMGIICDTEFESGCEYSVQKLLEEIDKYDCKNIIWTGGEPAQQLTELIVSFFKGKGYYQSIETSGLFSLPNGLDYVALSPKVAEHIIKKNFPNGVNELRYVRHEKQSIPQPSINADYLFISPHSDGDQLNIDNLKHCIELVKNNPKWTLSVQMHKIWKVL